MYHESSVMNVHVYMYMALAECSIDDKHFKDGYLFGELTHDGLITHFVIT